MKKDSKVSGLNAHRSVFHFSALAHLAILGLLGGSSTLTDFFTLQKTCFRDVPEDRGSGAEQLLRHPRRGVGRRLFYALLMLPTRIEIL